MAAAARTRARLRAVRNTDAAGDHGRATRARLRELVAALEGDREAALVHVHRMRANQTPRGTAA